MDFDLSKKGLQIVPSITLDITAKAKAMKDSGIDIVSFGAGEPDFNTPINIQNEAIKSIKEGLTRYTPASGVLELKEAICTKLKKENGLDYKPNNIIISNGAKHSLNNALMAILNPGDEVILGVPYWVSYPELIRIADGVPIYVETKEKDNFKFNVDDLNNVLTKKTKAIILNSPNNPTGTIYTEQELKEIADWAIENKIFVISDEIYEKLIYDGENHVSISSFNDKIKDMTILINGMSKAYAMAGWRIGYAAAHKDIIDVMSNIQSHSTSNPCSISQYASIEALNGNQDSIGEMKTHFLKRRDYMVETINSINGLSCIKPQGSFYVMVNFGELLGKTIKGKKINSSLDFATLLLEEGKVAVVPGVALGNDKYFRLSYATSLDNIKEGLKRIKQIVES